MLYFFLILIVLMLVILISGFGDLTSDVGRRLCHLVELGKVSDHRIRSWKFLANMDLTLYLQRWFQGMWHGFCNRFMKMFCFVLISGRYQFSTCCWAM